MSPDQCGSVGWASSCKAKGRWLDSQSGHMPGLQLVLVPGQAHTTGIQLMFLSLSVNINKILKNK